MTAVGEGRTWAPDGQPVIRRATETSSSWRHGRLGSSSGGGAREPARDRPRRPQSTPALEVVRRQETGEQAAGLRALLWWLLLLAATTGLLVALGRTPMASPPMSRPGDWLAWAALHSTEEVAFNLLRIVGLALSAYLLGVTTIGIVARLVAWAGLVRLADAITVDPVRQLLRQALGVTLAVTTTVSLPGTALRAATAAPRPDVTAPAATAPPSDTTVPTATGGLRAETSLRPDTVAAHDSWRAEPAPSSDGLWASPVPALVLPAGEAIEAPELPPVAPADLGSADPGPVELEIAPRPGERTVAPGDHFWRIAEETVGGDADDTEVANYWVRLIEANRDRLVDRSNPDLLFPGQVLVLPEVVS